MANEVKWVSWVTPFTKQCYVTLSLTLATAQIGLVFGVTSSLLPSLRKHDSIIVIDDSQGSWIVATPLLVATASNLVAPAIIGICGRNTASIICLVNLIISWLFIALATSFLHIMISRFTQGFSFAIINSLAPIYIGECTSPKNRGPFLTCLSLAISCGAAFAHAMGAYISHWQTSALICAILTFINLVTVLYIPESPSWLIDKGRFDEGKKSFVWLRGDKENLELNKMIEAKLLQNSDTVNEGSQAVLLQLKRFLSYSKKTISKPEFYKPIFIMIHLNIVMQFSGFALLTSYAHDIFNSLLGLDFNVDVVIISVDVQRIISNLVAMFVIRKVKRKTMLILTGSLNTLMFLALSGYVYGKSVNFLPDMPYLGILFIHLLMFSIALGTLPLPNILSGEIFPLQYRSFASTISRTFLYPLSFLTLKTVPSLITNIGIHGIFILYASILLYSVLVAYIFLPETKDRTLQDIENEFRGLKPLDLESTQPFK